MRLTVFGCGYVGLVTGTCLAEMGHDVLCVDINEARVRGLSDGIVPIYEPGLTEILKRNLKAGRLQFATTVSRPFDAADAYFIAVGTPAAPDGSADVSAVHAVAEQIAQRMREPGLIVVKSTVPVGTCEAIHKATNLDVASNPEFLREGTALQDFFYPDRVVIGASTTAAHDLMREIYEPLKLSHDKFVMTDLASSQLTKYAANTMLAMRVSFMNEMSRLCHEVGANIDDVRVGIGKDSRIGPRFLYAGPSWGGSCWPKDVQALAHMGRTHNIDLLLAEATHLANEEQAAFVAKLVEQACGGVTRKTIAFWGLAFKPETDDVRESPAIKLADVLLAKGADIVGHDPEAGKNFAQAMASYGERVRVVDRQELAIEKADALVLLTEWRCYRAPDFAEIRKKLPVVVDARNVWSRQDAEAAGLRYRGIGR
jgi:UDPglucose 6-dehydrogenase